MYYQRPIYTYIYCSNKKNNKTYITSSSVAFILPPCFNQQLIVGRTLMTDEMTVK